MYAFVGHCMYNDCALSKKTVVYAHPLCTDGHWDCVYRHLRHLSTVHYCTKYTYGVKYDNARGKESRAPFRFLGVPNFIESFELYSTFTAI